MNKDSIPPVSKPNKPPKGYIWHHHQDGKTMILVEEKIHSEFTFIVEEYPKLTGKIVSKLIKGCNYGANGWIT